MSKAYAATLFLMAATSMAVAGPYASAAGEAGSTAVHMDDSRVVSWATGYEDYHVGDGVDAIWQTPGKAVGKAEGTSYEIACLGRGGQITLTFDSGISDGQGFDFAVFENSISSGFLELAWVEVSSDGVNFFRFENDSLTAGPVNTYGILDPTDITGLAGKYMQGYGTPFDLADLKSVSPLLDVNNVRWIKIVDIVGAGTDLDSTGDPIYDPFPTSGSAGFDLDAVGVLHTAPEPGTMVVLMAMAGVLGGKRRKAAHA